MLDTKATTVEGFIACFSGEIRTRLEDMRLAILEEIPEAEECISYGIPAYKYKGKPVIYFAGYKNHCSCYPVPANLEGFNDEIKKYQKGKGTVQFPHSEDLPIAFIKALTVSHLSRAKNALMGKKK